jgi:hypothetical protein
MRIDRKVDLCAYHGMVVASGEYREGLYVFYNPGDNMTNGCLISA